jgi:hypothetical protein
MCIHKFYIFQNCGHSFFASRPLIPCADAKFTPLPPSKHYYLSRSLGTIAHEPFSSTCTPQAHPYRTIRINDGLCLDCEVRRKYLLAQAEQDLDVVKFEESKWRVQYVNEKARKKEEIWKAWGEPDTTISLEMIAQHKQRQKVKSGRVGFSGDSLPGTPKTPDTPSKRSSSRKSHKS